MRLLFATIFMLASSIIAFGQELHLRSDIEVARNGQSLASAWAGGMNEPQVSTIRLNNDTLPDLLVFDRSGNQVIPFIGTPTAQGISYVFAPEFEEVFPEMQNFVLARDINCDGWQDLCTANSDSSGLRIWIRTPGFPADFTMNTNLAKSDAGTAFVPGTDIPGIADIDGDGFMDLLSFDPAGDYIRWYAGTSCDSVYFLLKEECWGEFREAGLSNDIILDVTCPRGGSGTGRHAGSTVCPVDMNGDNAYDLLLGDLNARNIVSLTNGGTNLAADMSNVQTDFPANSTFANLLQFPAAFSLDLNQDQLPDLLVAPNAQNISINTQNLWHYQNTGSASLHQYTFVQDDFLGKDMIDHGTFSKPAWFDHNGDGQPDLVVGNFTRRNDQQSFGSSLALFENTASPGEAPSFSWKSDNYQNISQLFNPPLFGMHPAFGDLDGDGDQDMIIGDESGKIHWLENIAGAGEEAQFILKALQFEGIDVGGDAAPTLVDLNRDGLLDLLIGEKSGNLNYFENQGTPQTPSFPVNNNQIGGVDVMPNCCSGYSVPAIIENESGAFELFVGSEEGTIFHYTNIDGNLQGTWNLETEALGEIDRGSQLTINIYQSGPGNDYWVAAGNSRGGMQIYHSGMATSINSLTPPGLAISMKQNGTANATLDFTSLPLGKYEVTCFALGGRELSRIAWQSTDGPLPMASFQVTKGLYLIQIRDESGRSSTLKWLTP